MMIIIELAYQTQKIKWRVPEGSTLLAALKDQPLYQAYLKKVAEPHVGIFGKIVSLDEVLKPNDRIELYLPLRTDPMQKRRLKTKSRYRKKS